MKSVRKRLTYANVMSSIAVFLVLGGATAFAASTLGKNTVGTKQLKNNAVTGAKIKNGAVTGAKLQLSSIGKVPSASTADTANSAKTADTANSAKTADTANSAKTASSANTANTAKTADSASTATTATSANNANTVAGSTIRKFFYAQESEGPTQAILSLDGLTLTASCVTGVPALNATTSVPAMIHTGGTFLTATAYYVENDDFLPGGEVNLLGEETDSVQGTFTYAQPNGTVVTGTYESEEFAFEAGTRCVISGHAIG